MRIIVLDTLINQTKDVGLPAHTVKSIFSEFQRLKELESDENSLQAYLLKQNGKKMQGAQYIFKYRLNDGDRILYTYSEHLPWLKAETENSMVLLRYSKHDNQGEDAKKINREKRTGYYPINEVADSLAEMGFDESDIRPEDIDAWRELFTESFHNHHLAYVISDDNEYNSLSADEKEVILSSEQSECISNFNNNPGPTLIIGGAGSGKTLIAVHILIDAAKTYSNERLCYFTQSQALRNKVTGLFKLYGHGISDDRISFLDINDYCISCLNLKHKEFVRTEDFLQFLSSDPEANEIKDRSGLSGMEIWTDIRGVIKGGLSSEWTRTVAIPQENFQKGFGSKALKELLEAGYLRRATENKKKIELVDNVAKTIKRAAKDDSLSNEGSNALQMALDYFSNVDPNIKMISENEYAAVLEEQTTVDKAKRSEVWKICELYQRYLDQNGLYDENDLVRWMLAKGQAPDEKFDLSVVDEVQDYTELQIYLIRKLTAGYKIVFAGDEHQNINPASFSESRLKSLFYKENRKRLTVVRLRKNFRCQRCIIEVTNALAEMRKELIATGSVENEEPESAIQSINAYPNRLQYSADNLDAIITALIKYPKAVILVPNEDAKKQTHDRIKALKKDIVKEIGEERYTARENSVVYTVAEIKGMEYEYVLCLDLISIYKEIWWMILSAGRKQTKYRYYFNLLYVAMTRAQKFLCFIDQETVDGLEEELCLNMVDCFSKEALFINELRSDDSDWLEQAIALEKEGKYREALQYYKQAKARPECAYRCNYWLARESRDFDTAGKYSLLLDSPEDYPIFMNDIDEPATKNLLEVYLFLRGDRTDHLFHKPNVSQLIDRCYEAFDDDEISQARRVVLNVLSKATQNSVKNL